MFAIEDVTVDEAAVVPRASTLQARSVEETFWIVRVRFTFEATCVDVALTVVVE